LTELDKQQEEESKEAAPPIIESFDIEVARKLKEQANKEFLEERY